MQQNTLRLPGRPLASLLKRAHLLLLIVIGAVAVAVPMSAQSFTAASTKTGTILGTVVDTTDDPIPGANVILQGPAGDRLTAITKDDGGFAFDQAPAGVAYQITVTAEGFADWNSSITVEPGREQDATRDQTSHPGCAAGSHRELLLEGSCCPTAQS